MSYTKLGFKKVSRWIKIQENKRGDLFFRHHGVRYYLNNFVRRDSPWNMLIMDSDPEYIHLYDATAHYNPYFVEVRADGEAVRLYERYTYIAQ